MFWWGEGGAEDKVAHKLRVGGEGGLEAGGAGGWTWREGKKEKGN